MCGTLFFGCLCNVDLIVAMILANVFFYVCFHLQSGFTTRTERKTETRGELGCRTGLQILSLVRDSGYLDMSNEMVVQILHFQCS